MKNDTEFSDSTSTEGDPLLKISVSIGGKLYEEDLNPSVDINLDIVSLNTMLSENPGRFAWWAMLEALARYEQDMLQNQLESLEADLFIRYQSELSTVDDRGKASRPTIENIRSHVVVDLDRATIVDKLSEAKKNLGQITVGRQSIQHCKDSLITIASNMRAEMENQVSVYKRKMEDLMRTPKE